MNFAEQRENGQLRASLGRLALTGVVVLVAQTSPIQAQELVTPGSIWSYSDSGTAPADWMQTDFDDSTWPAGPAQLGCGETDENTVMGMGPGSYARQLCYFRHTFDAQPTELDDELLLRWLVDDGAVFYLNGEEIHRSRMAAGALTSESFALREYYLDSENRWLHTWVPKAKLRPGRNTLAVAVYQLNNQSSDLSFDLSLELDRAPLFSRKPYLQLATTTSMTLRWRTPFPSNYWLHYGVDPENLDHGIGHNLQSTDHQVCLQMLEPDTDYYYQIDVVGATRTSKSELRSFRTAPVPGNPDPFSVFVFGDSGTASRGAADVRDVILKRHLAKPAEFWLMLGDNAYQNGTDQQYQRAVFNFYPTLLRQLPLWSTRGNHETWPAVYYNIFAHPTQAEAGGLASGTEAYYSFNWGNVHFICLDSQGSNRLADGPMVQWLKQDMAQIEQDWIIAFWHHPPYTKGTHDSDNPVDSAGRMTQMREQVLPTLEAGGVDLVLAGHSHAYERSYMIGGHYGLSGEFAPEMKLDGGSGDPASDGPYQRHAGGQKGAVYCVAGSSGSAFRGSFDHPAMFRSLARMGALTLDFDGDQLDVNFLARNGDTIDVFRLVQSPAGETTPSEVRNAPKSGFPNSIPK
ncbi:MAG: metallophosphoesterase family protein [Planctomycetes bacterium]|nr:metallophosphoesterase family protein [Planctomycetota bacterium]